MAMVQYDGQAAVAASTVTVLLAGTQQPATIYDDLIGTPKSNPFTADAASGVYQFCAEQQAYDVLVVQPSADPSITVRTLPRAIFSGTSPARTATLYCEDPISGDQIVFSQQVY